MKTRLVALFAAVVVCVVLAGCAWLNPLSHLETGTYLINDNAPVINPDWMDDKTLVGPGSYTEIHLVAAGTGGIKQTYDPADLTVSRMSMMTASPDTSRVVMTAHFKGPDYDDTIGNNDEKDYVDILMYDFDSGELTNLTGSTSEYSGASFLSNTEVVYCEYDFSVTDKATIRIIRHNISTDVATTVLSTTIDAVDRNPTAGETYWWPKVAPGIAKVFVCATDHATAETYFKIFDLETGSELCDGSTVGTYDSISSGDWIDANTVVYAAGSKGNISVYVVDVSTGTGTVEEEFSAADPQISYLYGLNLSPDKTMVASHAAEFDANETFVTNRLFVMRIAAAE